jgi:DNA-binding transcriptional LysR family regulator
MTDASHITLLPRLPSHVRALAPGVALEAGRIDGELPGFLGLPAILSTTDLIAILPRHIGETLAHAAGLRVLPCPIAIAGFTVNQYWHARYHHDAANRWLRGVCAELFMKSASNP